MKQLNEFETLQEAQEYLFVVNPVLFTSDIMAMLLVPNDMYAYFNSQSDSICMATIDRLKTVSTFNFVTGTKWGDMNQASMDYLIQAKEGKEELITLKESLIKEANPIEYPYLKTTQTEFDIATLSKKSIYDVPANVNAFVHSFRLNSHLETSVFVTLEESLSKDGITYTDFNMASAFGQVQSDVIEYKAKVKATSANYRKLRIVSPLPLDIEKEV